MSPHTKGKEQAPVTLKKHQWREKKQQSPGGEGDAGGGGERKWLEEPSTKEN